MKSGRPFGGNHENPCRIALRGRFIRDALPCGTFGKAFDAPLQETESRRGSLIPDSAGFSHVVKIRFLGC